MISQVQTGKQKLPLRMLPYIASHGFMQNLTCRNLWNTQNKTQLFDSVVVQRHLLSDLQEHCLMTGCLWLDSDTTAAYIGARDFTHFPPISWEGTVGA